MLEKVFKLKENHTDVKTEILAGITTFMTMAYILAVNPSILSAAGMDQGAVFTATALASLIGTLCMAAFANYPFALAPGMGLNAYFAYTVVIGMGYSWQTALTAVFAEGIIFIILSLTNVREAIFNAIPACLKTAVSVGIGLFIAFLGLQNANIVVGGSTLVQLFSVDAYNQANGVEASFNNVGITVLLAIIGVLITAIMVIKNIKGNILWGILITWLLGIICQFTGLCDKNGKKIWENDIVKTVSDIYAHVKFGLYTTGFALEECNQGFYVDFSVKTYLRHELGYWNNKVEVRGNIFDNRDLLQEESDE